MTIRLPENLEDKVLLNLGCGLWLRKEFRNLDQFPEVEVRSCTGWYQDARIEDGAEYVQGNILHMPFPDDYADYVEMLDVIEHFPFRDVIPALQEVRRVLKPGAKLTLTTVNMDALCLEWLRQSCYENSDLNGYWEVVQGIFGNETCEGEFHRVAFNPRMLGNALGEAGFVDIDMTFYPAGMDCMALHPTKFNEGNVMRYEALQADARKPKETATCQQSEA